MRMAQLLSVGLTVVAAAIATAADGPQVTAHVEVFNEAGRFAGWPANNGIWNWGNEIVVGFTLGYHKEKTGHTIDPDRPSGLSKPEASTGV